jgi:hypothetical protein
MNNDRASRVWKANKENNPARERPKLDRLQRIQFLELVAQMASRATFERKLDLSSADIEFYKKELDIESPDEARRLARRLQLQSDDEYEARVLEETRKVREAEETAQARLEALRAKKEKEAANRSRPKVDVNKVRQEDADRQRLFEEQQSSLEEPDKPWRLSFEENAGSESEQIERFHMTITHRGLSFAAKRYGATPKQIRYEADRLGLSINWDIVRK